MADEGILDTERARIFNKPAYDESIKETVKELFDQRDLDDLKAELDRLSDLDDLGKADGDGEGKV